MYEKNLKNSSKEKYEYTNDLKENIAIHISIMSIIVNIILSLGKIITGFI